MTEFRKFPSLDNTYNGKFIERVMTHPCYNDQWLATEKLHGANFSFWYDRQNAVRIASRTQFVNDSFYGCGYVVEKYKQKFINYCEAVYPGKEVVVYGELFGGNIQREVKYREKDFAAFELVIDGVPQHKTGARTTFNAMGFKIPQCLGIGTLEEMLALDPEFISFEADPEAERHLQQSEGIVIEPFHPAWTGNGSRVYFKNKSKSFSERKDSTPKEPKKPVEIETLQGQFVYDLMACRLTASRVSAVLSKLGVLGEKEFGKLLGAFTQDILDEVLKEEDVNCKLHAGNDWSNVMVVLKHEMMPLLREKFVEQLEN